MCTTGSCVAQFFLSNSCYPHRLRCGSFITATNVKNFDNDYAGTMNKRCLTSFPSLSGGCDFIVQYGEWMPVAFQQRREASTLRKLLDTVEMHDDVTVELWSLKDEVDCDKDLVESLCIIKNLSAGLSRTGLFFMLAASLFSSTM